MTTCDFVHRVESLFPKSVVEHYRKIKKQRRLRERQSCYNKIAHGITPPVKVLFFALDSNTWKYDSLFQAMQKDSFFSPTILVVPQVNKGKEFMLYQLRHGCEYYESKGYPTICSYDEETDSYVDAFSFHPDIIFYSNPYDGLVDDRYNIRNYMEKTLTCYVNYTYCSVPYEWQCASAFHMKVWRTYVECDSNYNQIKQFYSANNCVVTGYPTSDLFASTKETGKDWKLKDGELKRVIWAPHHTIEGNTLLIQFSTFLLYCDFMLKVAEEYQETVQFVFKPHPLLLPALYAHPDWGKEKTDAYYEKWAKGKNTAYVNADYIDLFKSSDAMIHDCGSFIIEYLYVNKPVMFLDTYDRRAQSNEVAKKAYGCHYVGKKEDDIKEFIEKVVIGGVDSYEGKRNSFYDEYLLPPNGRSVAGNIIQDIKDALGK
ncbi:MAG: CDP-glycerol glycerophosphotransferase family protein [Bacteroidales bacterium]|nr:CDP-glycerol glycerophosphotransferase family protein [Bacteroidales bacterium]